MRLLCAQPPRFHVMLGDSFRRCSLTDSLYPTESMPSRDLHARLSHPCSPTPRSSGRIIASRARSARRGAAFLKAALLTGRALGQLGQLLLHAATHAALGPAALAALAAALFAAAGEHVRRRLELCRAALAAAVGGGPLEEELEAAAAECMRLRLSTIVAMDEAGMQVQLS